jgi:hypothetical protein
MECKIYVNLLKNALNVQIRKIGLTACDPAGGHWITKSKKSNLIGLEGLWELFTPLNFFQNAYSKALLYPIIRHL